MFEQILLAIIVAALSIFGTVVSYLLNLHISLGIAKQRLEKYSLLWSALGSTSPMDHDLDLRSALSEEERKQLYERMTRWYFEEQGGIVLSAATRDLYLTVKRNLVCDVDMFEPASVRHKIVDEMERSDVLVRQFSLLRTRMRADLAVYGSPFYGRLRDDDRALLIAVGENPDRSPWRPSPWRALWNPRHRPQERPAN